jgi:hypothetical protein
MFSSPLFITHSKQPRTLYGGAPAGDPAIHTSLLGNSCLPGSPPLAPPYPRGIPTPQDGAHASGSETAASRIRTHPPAPPYSVVSTSIRLLEAV